MAFRPSFLTQATLYKFRYAIGYGLLVCILLLIISVDINTLPNGISQAEMNSAAVSNLMSPRLTFDWVINAPYHALQKISIMVFGLSRASIVLPSLLVGFATIVLFMLTMRLWFRESIAVVTTIIAVTSSPFVSMMRSGTPEIMLSFWTILLLFAAVKFLMQHERAFVWKLLMAIAAVGLLYTPYGIYPLLAFSISGLLHPHVRSRLRRIKHSRLFILLGVGLVTLTPLIIYVVLDPARLAPLVGITAFEDSLSNIPETLSKLYQLYINVVQSGFVGTVLVPMFNIATVCLVLLGIFRVVKDRHTARSYALISWTIAVTIVTLLAPEQQGLVLMPVILLTAIGIETLIVDWYTLFPKNPYARVAGLIPLTILFIAIAAGNLSHYFNTHRYVSNSAYMQSLPSIKRSIVTEGNRSVVLVVNKEKETFYKILQRQFANLEVTTIAPAATTQPTLVLPSVTTAYPNAPWRIFTTSTAENPVALRVYRPQ